MVQNGYLHIIMAFLICKYPELLLSKTFDLTSFFLTNQRTGAIRRYIMLTVFLLTSGLDDIFSRPWLEQIGKCGSSI